MMFLFANILLRLELREKYLQVLNFISDFCVATYNLIPLVNAYLKIAKQLSALKEYDKSIRILKKALRVAWI